VVVSTFQVPPARSAALTGCCCCCRCRCRCCWAHRGCGRSCTVAEPSISSWKGPWSWSCARTRQSPQSLGPNHTRGTLLRLQSSRERGRIRDTGNLRCRNSRWGQVWVCNTYPILATQLRYDYCQNGYAQSTISQRGQTQHKHILIQVPKNFSGTHLLLILMFKCRWMCQGT
jgi:hypothetical protein